METLCTNEIQSSEEESDKAEPPAGDKVVSGFGLSIWQGHIFPCQIFCLFGWLDILNTEQPIRVANLCNPSLTAASQPSALFRAKSSARGIPVCPQQRTRKDGMENSLQSKYHLRQQPCPFILTRPNLPLLWAVVMHSCNRAVWL